MSFFVSGGVVVSLPMYVSESGDEGLGSMSPEPLSVITVTTEGHSVVNSEVVELRRQLERERHVRLHLEKQMRAIQSQLYPERYRDNQLITYQPHEVPYDFTTYHRLRVVFMNRKTIAHLVKGLILSTELHEHKTRSYVYSQGKFCSR